MSPASESIANVHEGALVRRLLAGAHWVSRVFGLYGIPHGARLFPEESLAGLGQGDVDVLAVVPNYPEFATAIQIKRVKVSSSTFVTGAPNGLRALAELIEQSNRLVRLAFSQVFAFSFIVVDSRAENGDAISYSGLTPSLRSVINSATDLGALLPTAGFVQYEFIQPMDSPPLGEGAYFCRPLRPAQTVAQAPAVTKWVANVLARHDA